MKVEIETGRAELLEKILAEAGAEGQSLSELEQRCLKSVFDADHRGALPQIEKEFPSKEAYDEFVPRACRLIERAVLHEAESRPELTTQARATLEKFMSGGGEAVVGPLISMAVFGKMPSVIRALGTAALVLPLAALMGWRLYADLAGGRMAASSRTVIQVALALVVSAAVWSVLNLLNKLSAK